MQLLSYPVVVRKCRTENARYAVYLNLPVSFRICTVLIIDRYGYRVDVCYRGASVVPSCPSSRSASQISLLVHLTHTAVPAKHVRAAEWNLQMQTTRACGYGREETQLHADGGMFLAVSITRTIHIHVIYYWSYVRAGLLSVPDNCAPQVLPPLVINNPAALALTCPTTPSLLSVEHSYHSRYTAIS